MSLIEFPQRVKANSVTLQLANHPKYYIKKWPES